MISVGSVGYYGYFTIFEKLGTKMKKKKVIKSPTMDIFLFFRHILHNRHFQHW